LTKGVGGLSVSEIEKSIGIEVYATRSAGIGGVIRQNVEDFAVEEVLVDGSKAQIEPSTNTGKTLGSSEIQRHFLLCVLVKRNWDTFSAVKAVADDLGISMGRIQIGGIKDARAVTAQYVTIGNALVEDVQGFKTRGLELRPVGYFHSQFSSYYLFGNSFQIIINSINHSKSVIKKRIDQTIQEIQSIGGVPNFFGHQRFGTTRPITHLVGKTIVKGDLEKAAMLFLAEPSPNEHSKSREARTELKESQDFKQALQNFPKHLRYERLMLRHLTEKPTDYVGAFRRLPVKLQKLFVNAHQSYLFNRFLSGRMKFGLSLNKAEIGDYVVGVERSGLSMIAVHKMVTAETAADINRAIEAGKMRLALPIMGSCQSSSEGAQGDIEKQILETEEVTTKGFRIRTMPEIASKGSLRVTLTSPIDFLVKNMSSVSAKPFRNRVKVSFTLQRGSYATVILREIMKPNDLIEAGF